MIEEWKDNIKLFSKSDERANDCKKLRENMRFQNTGIKVDKLASKLAIEFIESDSFQVKMSQRKEEKTCVNSKTL